MSELLHDSEQARALTGALYTCLGTTMLSTEPYIWSQPLTLADIPDLIAQRLTSPHSTPSSEVWATAAVDIELKTNLPKLSGLLGLIMFSCTDWYTEPEFTTFLGYAPHSQGRKGPFRVASDQINTDDLAFIHRATQTVPTVPPRFEAEAKIRTGVQKNIEYEDIFGTRRLTAAEVDQLLRFIKTFPAG